MKPENGTVIVRSKGRVWKIANCHGKHLTDILQENHIYVSNQCQGNGTCGKCKIKVLKGECEVTNADAERLTKEEIEQNIRLACRILVKKNLEIEVMDDSEEEIVAESITVEKKSVSEKACFIAIDIGTTTIAMALVEEKTGKVCDTYTSLNHQRTYGADVISRIKASNDGKGEVLKQSIREDLWKGICSLTAEEKSFKESGKAVSGLKRTITGCIIAGNTAMLHLLMGYSCESLGKAPFFSKHLEQEQCTLSECIGIWINKEYADIPVVILPGISAFVGADILADVLACPAFETKSVSLLLDLGTNGEMVIGNKDRMWVTSAAAGPAFEGGNITCGMASIPGAISKVKIKNNKAVVRTIGVSEIPRGICGSGLISAMAELKRNRLLDENGCLRYPFCEMGYPLWTYENGEKIAVYQQDIRQFQMAKAAVRAGIEVLIKRYGCKADEIGQVYLAGGFGKGIAVEDAIETGILPKEFLGKVSAIGNGALAGCILYGRNAKNYSIKTKEICSKAENVSLAETEDFEERYFKYMEI